MAGDLADVAHVERTPLLEGKNMSQIMGPLARHDEARPEEAGARVAEANGAAPAVEAAVQVPTEKPAATS
jgi:hypothetical protein